MTDEEINRAIAEHFGWKRVNKRHHSWEKNIGGLIYVEPPDYTTELNAMHEAENQAIFPAFLGMAYGRELHNVCKKELPIQLQGTQWERWSFSATARQRAEAFLRTVGKWREEGEGV